MKSTKLILVSSIIGYILFCSFLKKDDYLTVKPTEYKQALRNPLKGFTTRGITDHPWATTAQTYIRWNEIENDKSDGVNKIINVCNQKWSGIEEKNIKVIPRVYLHWSGNKKYWPADMREMDYSSQQFKERVLRLIKRLGECWDNDPRVAFVEMGVFGKWGEQHSPYPTKEMEKLVGHAFSKAFKNKKVSVRRNWERFTENPYGVYWDSWAHYNQMWRHGNSIEKMNENGRYLQNYVGGEVAYDWGDSKIQPGASPTESVAFEKHRNFLINSIRWLHCTQLRWIEDYDKKNNKAIVGAEKIQKAFGYRYLLNEVRFTLNDSLKLSFDITNIGSAPFYYDWPVEVALLDTINYKPVWKSTLTSADIRNWLPGEGWSNPEWKATGSNDFNPDPKWNQTGRSAWSKLPVKNTITENFKVKISKGTYILSIAILDPAGNLPSLRLATSNYLKGGRHPIGLVNFTNKSCYKLPVNFVFDDPAIDRRLHYKY
ncbi:DUF4832 domain-containing protein [Zobellia uliginosa]|uniref:DUF4832 domain-containing protein n=1 Tax=Zobellia uliginosa TaxID=143224 RepID=UPI001C07BC45|nr:DUF4832 domain-containing protein [Zobellia uliginosa]MBU2945744.1 DUF4832 domain-containing protein [Zobellia uliginosa]